MGLGFGVVIGVVYVNGFGVWGLECGWGLG